MSAYEHSLAFSVRAKETEEADVTVAPRIDSAGVFQPSPAEIVVETFEKVSVTFARKKIIEIPGEAPPRQRARLEKKRERQKWEHLATLSKSSVAVTSLRVVWIAKQDGSAWSGFSPQGLVKAAAKAAASAVMKPRKWYVGQVLLSMIGSVASDGDRRLLLLFSDSEAQYRVDVERMRGAARETANEIHQRSVTLIRRVYEQYSSGETEAIDALRDREATPYETWRNKSVIGYSVPYVCVAPILPTKSSETTTP